MKKLPRISIVTPSYMQGEYLEWTLRSVLNQGYANLEYIVMDGGSTDETTNILDRYADKLAYVVSEKDGGQADAIARGLERSTGDIMAYLNSDDMLCPGALHHVARYFDAHPHVDVIYSHRCVVDENNRVTSYWILPPHSNFIMKKFDYIPQETVFWRRRIFEKAGNIDPSYRFAMDYDLFVRFMQLGTFRRLHRFHGAFRAHGQSKTTTQYDTIGKEEVELVRKKYNISVTPFDINYDRMMRAFVVGANRCAQLWKRRILPATGVRVQWDFGARWNGQLACVPTVGARSAA